MVPRADSSLPKCWDVPTFHGSHGKAPPHAPAPKLPSYRDCRGGKAEAYRRGDYHGPDTGSYSAHDTARSSGSATPWEQDTSQKLPHL